MTIFTLSDLTLNLLPLVERGCPVMIQITVRHSPKRRPEMRRKRKESDINQKLLIKFPCRTWKRTLAPMWWWIFTVCLAGKRRFEVFGVTGC